MIKKEKYTPWLFVIFPAITMLLGWGLRGFIGGGPFGAMIPGAMLALSISLLLELPPAVASIFVVFSAIGIGLGGEMTYGQTIGFLLKPETIWWGTLGLTVKGGIWGLLGGIVLGMGLLFNRLSKKTIIVAILLLLGGMLIGFKLINQPMIIYFSDPAKPRPESWGALLVGAVTLFIFLKNKVESSGFKIITRFALWGLIGGGLGFGLGGFWMALGNQLPKELIFQNWWKAMEFTFGLLLGAALGYASWLSRKAIDAEKAILSAQTDTSSKLILVEFTVTFIVGLLIFWLFPLWLDPVVEAGKGIRGFTMISLTDIAKILSNYAFFGLIILLAVMRYPSVAWQMAVTLTFCHTVIDLMSGFYPDIPSNSELKTGFVIIFVMSLVVAALAAWFQRHKNSIRNLFILLVWSTIVVAYLRLAIHPEILNISGLSFYEFVFGRFFVHIIFTAAAIYVSWISYQKMRDTNRSI
jgi:hypothetical protein